MNVTLDLHTGLSKILNHYEQSTQGSTCVFIPSYRHDISIAVRDDLIYSLRLYYTVTVVTLLTFLLWLC